MALLEPIGRSPRGLFVQRLVAGGWSAPVAINSGAGDNDFELSQGAGGRLTALWTDGSPYRLNYTTVEAARGGARVSPRVALRRASFGRVRGARRSYVQRFRAGYAPTRTNLRVRVRLRPRSRRSRTLTLRARRCGVPAG